MIRTITRRLGQFYYYIRYGRYWDGEDWRFKANYPRQLTRTEYDPIAMVKKPGKTMKWDTGSDLDIDGASQHFLKVGDGPLFKRFDIADDAPMIIINRIHEMNVETMRRIEEHEKQLEEKGISKPVEYTKEGLALYPLKFNDKECDE